MDTTNTIWEKIFTPIFGPNWKTYLSAFVAFLFFAAAFLLTPANQSMFMALNLPETLKVWTIDACKFVGFISAMLFAYHTASNTGMINGTMKFGGSSDQAHRPTHMTMLAYTRHARYGGGVRIFQWLIILAVILLCALISFRFLWVG